jgi:hypothetical protein
MVLQNHDRSDLGSGPEKKQIKVSSEFSAISSQNHKEEAEETTSDTEYRLRPPRPPFLPRCPAINGPVVDATFKKKTELVFALTMSSQSLHIPSGKITQSDVQTHLRVRGKAPLQGKLSVATSRPESRPRESRRRRRRRRSSGVQAAG